MATSSTAAARLSPQLFSTVLRRAPFVIFSKRAPLTLPKFDYDKDFTYFFFSDRLATLGGLDPSFLTTGQRNAKTDFPVDYRQYFVDDAAVCQEFPFPKVKLITEPWKTPSRHTIVETRKTCITLLSPPTSNEQSNEKSSEGEAEPESEKYMLGCFGQHDDIELGLTTFVATTVPPELPILPHVPLHWYTHAFEQLPLAVRLYRIKDVCVATRSLQQQPQHIASNSLATHHDFAVDATNAALRKIRDMLDNTEEKSPYNAFLFGGPNYRLWMWRVTNDGDDDDILAVAFRRKRDVMPYIIEDSFSSELPTHQFVKEKYGRGLPKQ